MDTETTTTQPAVIVGVRFKPPIRDAVWAHAAAVGERPSDTVRKAVVAYLYPDATPDEVARLAST